MSIAKKFFSTEKSLRAGPTQEKKKNKTLTAILEYPINYINNNKGGQMAKTMTKYQLDHFQSKVRRNFNPLIEEQELLVKQYRAEATQKIVGR